MTEQYSTADLDKISRFVSEHIGFSYAPERRHDLLRGFTAACKDLGADNPTTCLKLLGDPQYHEELEAVLVRKLTIGETYFFRDRKLFSHLRDHLLPELIKRRRIERKYLRIWSAACSSGEEPYSVAMLLRYLIPDIDDWDILILATDINPGSLHAAERGIYSKWSFREKEPIPINQYISPAPDGRFHVSDTIRKMVRFDQLNLISDRYPSTLTRTTGIDIILCRNVLMYFSTETAYEVVDRLNASLVDKGWLIVSPQEISYAQRPGFVQRKQTSVFLYQKDSLISDPFSQQENIVSPEYLGSLPSEKNEIILPHENISVPISSNRGEVISSMHNGVSAVQLFPRSSDGAKQTITVPIPSVSYATGLSETSEILISQGRLADAEYQLSQIKTPVKKNFLEMEMLAKAYADQGDTDRALGWCDRILGSDPLRAGAYHLRAVILFDRGENVAAVQALRQALYADPDYVPAHLMLGMIMGNQGRNADAQRQYQTALKILTKMKDDALVDDTEGMPAVKLREMVQVLLEGVKV